MIEPIDDKESSNEINQPRDNRCKKDSDCPKGGMCINRLDGVRVCQERKAQGIFRKTSKIRKMVHSRKILYFSLLLMIPFQNIFSAFCKTDQDCNAKQPCINGKCAEGEFFVNLFL